MGSQEAMEQRRMMAAERAARGRDTQFTIDFNFTSAEQRDVLKYLQENHYELIAYKGAKGAGSAPVQAGLPTWFALPFGNLFGEVGIAYHPVYKVYVFNQAKIAANTTIKMQSLSQRIGLGHGLTFQPDGSFTDAGDSEPGTITLHNNRPAETPDVTVGLAGLVTLPTGRQYLPFCAFTLPPQNSVTMEPVEQVAIMAARVDLHSGNVQANAAAPGCSFSFDSEHLGYDLMIEPSTYTITNDPGTTPTRALTSGQSLDFLNNS